MDTRRQEFLTKVTEDLKAQGPCPQKTQGSLKWILGEINYLSPGMQPLKPCLIPWAHRLCLYQ